MNHLARIFIALVGVPVELVLRALDFKWTLDEELKYVSPDGWSITAEKGMKYDSFTWAPNLRCLNGSRSKAAAIHDKGWVTGKKDDGTILTFDENNKAFRSVLDKEEHPEWVRDAYERGVSLPFMRKKWLKIHGHE